MPNSPSDTRTDDPTDPAADDPTDPAADARPADPFWRAFRARRPDVDLVLLASDPPPRHTGGGGGRS